MESLDCKIIKKIGLNLLINTKYPKLNGYP